MPDLARRSLLTSITTTALATGSLASLATTLGDSDPIYAAIAHHAEIWATLGPMPDDEDGRDFAEWDARSALAWATWRDLVSTRPTTRPGCIALARYVARYELAINIDRDDSLARALFTIADTLQEAP